MAAVVGLRRADAAGRQPDAPRDVRRRSGPAGAGPLGVAVLALVPLLLFWQWSPALDAILRAGNDPSTERGYYRPLHRLPRSVGAETGRVEVVPTARHWEAAFVAARFPIARGWERQLDIRFNPLFYAPDLTAGAYHDVAARARASTGSPCPMPRWTIRRRTRLPSSRPGLAYLRPVWAVDHWRVYEVVDARGLVDGPAEVVDMDIDSITLDVTGARRRRRAGPRVPVLGHRPTRLRRVGRVTAGSCLRDVPVWARRRRGSDEPGAPHPRRPTRAPICGTRTPPGCLATFPVTRSSGHPGP